MGRFCCTRQRLQIALKNRYKLNNNNNYKPVKLKAGRTNIYLKPVYNYYKGVSYMTVDIFGSLKIPYRK